jgi:probable HAF family extracellular repeat protein
MTRLIRLASVLFAARYAAAGTITYNVIDLGSLGGSDATAFSINQSGVAAGAAFNNFGYLHAFTNTGSGMNDLTVNTAAGEGSASSINSSGQVAGTQYVNGQAYATIWTNGVPQSAAGAGSYGTSINSSGEVAGMYTTGGQGHAFVESNGTIQDLGTLGGGSWSSAYGINDAGEIAGYGMTSSGAFRAFVWSPATGYTMLGTLGGSNSYAMAINSSGVIAGSSQLPSGYSHAFVANGNALIDLGTLGSNSYAYGINTEGDVVGYSTENSGDRAFLYRDGVMIDLNSLIDPNSGWILEQAYAINDNDQIVGEGLFDGVSHAFRLDDPPSANGATVTFSDPAPVPEPATWTVAALGLAALIVRSRIRLRPRRPARLQARPRSDVWRA